jgi:hypothetical protein
MALLGRSAARVGLTLKVEGERSGSFEGEMEIV